MININEIAEKIAEWLKNEACDCEWAHGPTPICISENFDQDKAVKIIAEELRLLEVRG